ncbi:tetratricopeptide repeat protein [Algoriphagus terrigena]|uniref:tetratricopeptide repeat protein n=1 Tax=Algoriphagus terrigena TaxID=344884 RepID=UPI000A04C2DD|nr:tetratricopeptide repeat protein [Algoriphagus terrigena]
MYGVHWGVSTKLLIWSWGKSRTLGQIMERRNRGMGKFSEYRCCDDFEYEKHKMKKVTLMITFIAAVFSACSGQGKVEKLGQQGVQLFEQGDIQGALSKFEEIIKVDDKIAEAHLRKGDCLDLLGDVRGSLDSYSKAIELEPKNKIAIYNRALSYEKLGDFEDAISDYRKAIEVDLTNNSELDNKLIYHNLGILYGQQDQLQHAIDAFSNAIEIDSEYADAYHNKGFAYQLQGNHIKAIENFDKALELDPTNRDYKASKDRSLKMKS